MINHTPTKGTQDWQLEIYEMQGRHNRFIRHQRVVDEMEREVQTWGRNMSKPRIAR